MFRKVKIKKKIFPIFLLALIGTFLVVASALALDVGLQYGTASGLGTQDLRLTIMNIIRAVLGFLAVLSLVIIVYCGLERDTQMAIP